MLRWILFSTLASGLFYGLYCLTLRRDRWLQLSRAYLIITLAFSLALPFIRLPQRVVNDMVAVPVPQIFQGDEITVTPDGMVDNGIDMLPAIWTFGMVLTAAYVVFQLIAQGIAILVLRRKYTVYGADDGFLIPRGTSLILVPDDTAPYSFFNQIVVGNCDLSDEELRCILAHESLHVRRAHSFDLLAMRLMCCVLWFNPFAWLLTRELRAVHEYQADAASLDSCSRESYLHLLYQQVTGIGYGHITNNFQSINIKKRIVMMNKTTTRFGAWKALVALPVAALLLMVGCKPATPEADASAAQPQEVVVNTNDTIYNDLGHPVEVDPEFPGGMEAMMKYLAENIKYPEQAKSEGIQGRVFVRFVIEADGSVTNAQVLRGIGGGCDEEALRVVNAMPNWTPGKQQGKPVRVQFNLPITFKLQE